MYCSFNCPFCQKLFKSFTGNDFGVYHHCEKIGKGMDIYHDTFCVYDNETAFSYNYRTLYSKRIIRLKGKSAEEAADQYFKYLAIL